MKSWHVLDTTNLYSWHTNHGTSMIYLRLHESYKLSSWHEFFIRFILIDSFGHPDLDPLLLVSDPVFLEVRDFILRIGKSAELQFFQYFRETSSMSRNRTY